MSKIQVWVASISFSMIVSSAAQLSGGVAVGSYVYTMIPPAAPKASVEVAVTVKPSFGFAPVEAVS